MGFPRMRFVLLGSLWLSILDSANDSIPHLRGAYPRVVFDTICHHFSGFAANAGIPHRVENLFCLKSLFFAGSLCNGVHE
jgi:hypothetical protein